MAKISLIGVGALTAGVASPISVPVHAYTQSGDIMLLILQGRPSGTAGSNDSLTASGWTQRGTRIRQEIGTDDLILELWWKVAGSSETNYSISAGTAFVGGTTEGYSGYIVTFRGVDTTTPFDDNSQVTSSGAAASTFTPTAYTTSTANAMALSIVATGDDNALNLNTTQGFLLTGASGTGYHTTTGSDHAAGLAIKEISSPGSVTQPTWNESAVGPDAWVAIADALRPASDTYHFEENWFGLDGGSWDSGRWPTISGTTGAVQDLQASRGRLTSGTTATTGNSTALSSISSLSDFDMRIHYRLQADAPTAEVRFRRTGSSDYYTVKMINGGSNVVQKVVSGTPTTIGSWTRTHTAGDGVNIRIRCVGTTIQVRHWKNTEAEPGTWNACDTTDSAFSSGGVELSVTADGNTTADDIRFMAMRVYAMPTGTVAVTEGADTSSADGTVTGGSSVTGTAAVTEGADTPSASGWAQVTGTVARTEGADTSSATGAQTFTGTAAPTEGGDTPSATGWAQVTGTVAKTEGADISSASGTQTFTGTAAPTEGADTSSSTGALTISGTAAPTEGADSSTAAGWAQVTGTVAKTEGADTSTASGALTISGTAAVTEVADSPTGSGWAQVTGTVAATEAANTSSASGALTITGTSSNTETGDSGTATGWAQATGTVAATETGDSSSASGSYTAAGVSGTAAVTEGADTASASGALTIAGSGAPSEAQDGASASGWAQVTGTVSKTEGADTGAASGALSFNGTAAVTEGADVSSSTGILLITGTVAVTEAPNTSGASGLLTITGTVAVTEAPNTSSGVGTLIFVGTATVTEGADQATADGTFVAAISIPDPYAARLFIQEGHNTATLRDPVGFRITEWGQVHQTQEPDGVALLERGHYATMQETGA